jgi:hypothetical protein
LRSSPVVSVKFSNFDPDSWVMQQWGLIDRKAYPVVEYSLTDRGQALLPILAEIMRWGATGAHEEILGFT